MYQPPPHPVPINNEIQRVKLEIEQRRLKLREVNTQMANIRARYQQWRVGGIIGMFQRGMKNDDLAALQPTKERLQREKLKLEHYLNQLKTLKVQGTKFVTLLPPKSK
jgi:hypothetical protein